MMTVKAQREHEVRAAKSNAVERQQQMTAEKEVRQKRKDDWELVFCVSHTKI